MNLSFQPETKNEFFKRLHSNPRNRVSHVRKPVSDSQSRSQKEMEECSFKPKINGDSPFISERTLRNIASKRVDLIPSSDDIVSSPSSAVFRKKIVKNKKENGAIAAMNAPLAGMFEKTIGFIRGPPSTAGIPIYYFNTISPPSFEDGKYSVGTVSSTGEEYEEVEVSDDDAAAAAVLVASAAPAVSDDLQPPALPLWAFKKGGDPSRGKAAEKKAVTIVINKSTKPKEEPAEATGGWAGVLAEMQKKRDAKNRGSVSGQLKKVEEVKKPTGPIKKKKKKAGSGGFTDVMDELSYRLAKMRGEIVEEEGSDDNDDNEEVAAAAPPPPPPGAGKPDIASMLAAKLKPPAAITTTTTTAAASTAASSSVDIPNTPAVPRPPLSNVPLPPPVPEIWPPLPHLTVYAAAAPAAPNTVATSNVNSAASNSSSSIRSSSTAAGKTKKTVKKLRKTATGSSIAQHDLPEGYFMAEPVAGMVQPGQFISGGKVTEIMLESLKVAFQCADTSGNVDSIQYVEVKRRGMGKHSQENRHDQISNKSIPVADKLAIGDLPLPPDFHAAVDRMQKSKELREAKMEQERSLELRSFLLPHRRPYIGEDEDQKIASQFNKSQKSEGTSADKSSNSMAHGVHDIKKEVTVAVDFRSNVDKHFENKSFSFRRPVQRSSDDKLPLSENIPRVMNSPIYGLSGDNIQNAFWMSNLRADNNNMYSSGAVSTAATPLRDSRRMGGGGGGGASSSSKASPQQQQQHRARSPHRYDTSSGMSMSEIAGSSGRNTVGGNQSYIDRRSMSPASIHRSGSNRLSDRYGDGSSRYGDDDVSVFTEASFVPGSASERYVAEHYRQTTVASSPYFLSDEVVTRKQSSREQRRQQEIWEQQEELARQQAHKELLRIKAQRRASELGTHRSEEGGRFHRHEKFVRKYDGKEHVGGVDLTLLAQVAYQEYSMKHLSRKQEYFKAASGSIPQIYSSSYGTDSSARVSQQNYHAAYRNAIDSGEKDLSEYDDIDSSTVYSFGKD